MVSGEIIINLKINVVIKTYKEIAIASKEMLCGFEMDQATIYVCHNCWVLLHYHVY